MTLISHLSDIEATGLIRLAALHPELEYLFRHALVQDTAYASLVRADKTRLHRLVGQALQTLYSDRLDELAGMLAHHFAQAGEQALAIEYSRRAAQLAIGAFAYDEALRHLHTALEMAEAGGDLRLAVQEELADAYRIVRQGLRAIPLYREALTLAQARAGKDRLAEIRLHRKILQTLAEVKWTVDVEQFRAAYRERLSAREGLLTGLEDSRQAGPSAETVRLFIALSLDAWRSEHPPDWEAAQHYAEQAVAAAEGLGNGGDLSRALGALADVLDGRGLLRENVEACQRRLALTRAAGFQDLRERLDGVRAAGMALMYVGEYAEALSLLAEAERLARSTRSVNQEFNALSLQCQCL
jgi:tetratricopeptide (TPR) repeat protein